MKEQFKTTVHGHVKITDADTGEVLVDKDNAIHNQNMAVALARGLANNPVPSGGATTNFQIYAIEFGNGGSVVSSTNDITFLPPNVTGSGARLYNATYCQCVDRQQSVTPSTNSVTYQQNGSTTIVIITATISAGEPTGQPTSDTPPNPDLTSQFSFDELGLFTYDVGFESLMGTTGDPLATPTNSLLLSHIIFSPIAKTSNRSLTINYTLSISVS
jgi:hypothetical protein